MELRQRKFVREISVYDIHLPPASAYNIMYCKTILYCGQTKGVILWQYAEPQCPRTLMP